MRPLRERSSIKRRTGELPPTGKQFGVADELREKPQIDDGSTPAQLALPKLYRRYAPWLHAALRRRGAEDAEDIVQDTYVRLARDASAPVIESPQAFLLRVAENILRSRIRRERAAKRTAPDLLLQDVVHSLKGPQLETLILREAILALPEAYRDVFVLNRFSDMSYAEIAAARGLTVKVVEYRVSRALAILRRALA